MMASRENPEFMLSPLGVRYATNKENKEGREGGKAEGRKEGTGKQVNPGTTEYLGSKHKEFDN